MRWLDRLIEWLPWLWPIFGWYGGGVSIHDHNNVNSGGALGDAADRAAWFGLEQILAPTAFPAANAVNLTNLPQTYGSLLLVISGASCDTETRSLQVKLSHDNGGSFNTASVYGDGFEAGTNIGFTNAGTLIISGNQAATGTFSYAVRLAGYQAGPYLKADIAGITGARYSANVAYMVTTAIDALQIIWNGSGNFDAGTYALYGMR